MQQLPHLMAMIKNDYGQPVYNESDIVDLILQGIDVHNISNIIVDNSVDLGQLNHHNEFNGLSTWVTNLSNTQTQESWDRACQQNWHMPDEYKNLDIAEHVLSLCKSQPELQRVGDELLLYQEKNLFELLKFLKYLVDTMKANNIIWGVGRGSSVASYVLYLLEVHKINSMFYDLDVHEFLR